MKRYLFNPQAFILFFLVPAMAHLPCPPNNLTVTPGVGSLNVSWENPGIYYGTHVVEPLPINYHTGTVDGSDGAFTEESYIRCLLQEQGWAMFDISLLPPGQEPQTVEFNFYVSETYYPYWAVTPVSSDPLTTDATTLYDDITAEAGTDGVSDYGSFYELEDFSPGQYSYSLMGNVFADIAATSLVQDWFTIGIVDWDYSSTYYISLHGWSEANPPSLTVTYGAGERYIVPAIPHPGASAEEIAQYKDDVTNGLQEELETAHAQVYADNANPGSRHCLGATGYYLHMDGDTLMYTYSHSVDLQGTIGQEYCFSVTSETSVPDSLEIITSDTVMVIDSTTTDWDTTYVEVWDTTYNVTWSVAYSEPSDTVCGSPVQFLLCPATDFYSVSSYADISLHWADPFTPGLVEAWGSFYGGSESNMPLIDNVTKIASGWNHMLLLKGDSTVYNWPTADWLQLPDESNHGFVDVAAGYFFNIGLRADGTMEGWWNSTVGQGEPPDSITDGVAVAAGSYHGMVLRSDSTVVVWGDTSYSLHDVPEGLNDVIQIDAGYGFCAALRSNGTVVVWGNFSESTPENLTDVIKISVGGNHIMALKSDGTVVAWGADGFGQIVVPENLANVADITAGGYHSIALKSNGQIITWGRNDYSQTEFAPFYEGLVEISAGNLYSAVLLADAGDDCGTSNGYTIYADGDSVGTTTDNNYTVTNLSWGEEVCYNIAVNYDEGYSAWTDTICASMITPTFCNTDTLVAESDYNHIELSWPDREDENCGTFLGYIVYQDGTPIDTVNETTHTTLDAAYGVDYCYTVVSLYEEGLSASTDTVCTSLVTPQLCLADSITATPGDHEATLSWQEPYTVSRNRPNGAWKIEAGLVKPFSVDSEQQDNREKTPETQRPSSQNRDEDCGDFVGYVIYQDGDSVAFISDSSTTLLVDGLENGTEYCFSVAATYSQGASAISEDVCVIPHATLREHNTDVVQVSITNEGNIGFTEQGWANDSTLGNGTGFSYYGNNYLFEAGLLLGTGPDQVSDCIRNNQDGFEEDLVEEEGTYLHIDTAGTLTNEEGLVVLNDSGADNPIGIQIIQKTFADNSFQTRNGVLFHYTLVNENSSDVAGLYAGLFFDWDIMDFDTNSAHYDSDHQMVYVQDQEESPTHFAATMLMNVGLGANIDVFYNVEDSISGGAYSEQIKWAHISGGVNEESAIGADVSTYAGIGPVDIPAGDSVSFGIVVLAASSAPEMDYVAGEMKNFWDTHFPEDLGNETDASLPYEFALHQNYPNPFNPVTNIRFDIPEESHVSMDIYNLVGQKVRTLFSGNVEAGFHSVQWNGTNDDGEELASGMYIYRMRSNKFTSVKKLVLMK